MKVLFISPRIPESRHLEATQEWKQLLAAAELHPQLSIERVEPGTLEALEERLRALKSEPAVLHFSGHSSPFHELQVQPGQEVGGTRQVTSEQFARLLGALGAAVRLLVLNVCFSRELAELAAGRGIVDCVIGMDGPIPDHEAIRFADALYRSIAQGETLLQAFDLAKGATHENIPYIQWGIQEDHQHYRLLEPLPNEFEAGKEIHGKELVELCFQDDVSEVWRTRDPRFSMPPTLYRVFPRRITEQQFTNSANRVSRLSSLFGHRGRLGGHILKVNRINNERPFVFEYSIEWPKWQTLGVWGRKLQRPLSYQEQSKVAEIIRRLAQMFAHAYQERLVHGMLNPNSVFLSDGAGGFEVIVADYGLSPMISQDFVNKSQFVAKERQGRREAAPLDDIYALGALWLSLLVGPDSGRDVWASFLDWYEPLHRKGMTFDQAQLIARCVAEPERRPQSVADLQVEISQLFKLKRKTSDEEDEEDPLAPPPPRLDSFVNSLDMEFVRVSSGDFIMGSLEGEEGRRLDEGPQHRVKLSEFYISTTVVTRAHYIGLQRAEVKDGLEPPLEVVGKMDEYPLTHIAFANRQLVPLAWEDAVRFCQRLTELSEEKLLKGRKYRLPTEAEWEYCCRAGTTGAFHYGLDADPERSNFKAGAAVDTSLAKAKSFRPNEFGLYNMHGNVWEYCQDLYSRDYYRHSEVRDPRGPVAREGLFSGLRRSRTTRVVRGGDFNSPPGLCRSATRGVVYTTKPGGRPVTAPTDPEMYIGFRVVCELP